MTTARIDLDRWKLASLALIPVSLALILVFTVLDIRTGTEPPYLLSVLNTLFIGIIPIVIAFIAFRSYRSSGSTSLFMMGSGMLIFGIGSIAAGWLIGLPGGTNISVAIYDVCILISAVFYLAGALLTFTGSKTLAASGTVRNIAAVTAGILVFVAVFIVLIVSGSVPPFFIAGSGPTVLRQVVLSLATAFLAVASILLFRLYHEKREDFFFWYAVSLAVIAIGLIAALLTPALGSPVNWVSRAMQYVGAGFALVAILVAVRLARDRGHSLEDTLSVFFADAEVGYKSLIETATDAIVVFDSDDRVLVWNRAAEKMFGYDTAGAVGASFFALAIPDDFVDRIKNNFRIPAGAETGENAHEPVEIVARRKDGSTFPAEITLSRHLAAGTPVSTSIIRDLTVRRKAEEALRQSNETLSSLNEELTNAQEELHQRNEALLRSEHEIAVKNAQLQALFDYSSASLVLFDAKKPYTVLAHNTYYQKLWAEPFRSNGMVGKNLYDFVPEVEVSGVMAIYDEVVATRQARTLLNFPYDGMERGRTYWNWHLSPVIQDGEVVALAHMGIDVTNEVTALMKVEETAADLRASEERMRIALEAADLGTWSFDIATGVAEHSLRHDQVFGYPDAVPEWLYEISIRHMLPEFHAVAREAVEEAMKTGTASFEVQVRWPDGSIHWINPFGRVQYDRDGRPVRMSGVVSDITERRNAQDHVRNLLGEVQREKDRLASLVSSISDEVWFADTRKNFTLANPSALREFALASGIIDIEKFAASLEVYRPDGSPRPVEEAPPLRALEGEEVRNQEEMIRTPGKGEIRTGQVSANPVRDASGTIVGSVSVVRDITDQKRLEEDLQNTLQRFYHILSGMPYGILLVTGENRVEFTNQAFCDFFSLDEAPSDLQGLTAQEFLEKIRPAYRDPDGALTRIGEIVRLGEPVKAEDVPMSSGRAFLRDFMPVRVGGKVFGRLWIHVDITDRKKAEELLRESEERFRELAEKAGSIILRFDPAGRITYFNEFAEQFFGFLRDEILGKPAVGTIIPANDSSGKDLDKMVTDIVAHPDRYATNENENIRKNGERVWIRWTNKPVFNPDGSVREFTTIGSDITDRRRAETELVRREKQLNEALGEKEILLAEIHHRVKNNLTAFISLLALEGSVEETPAGLELKKDLQNRARSMALIHETLYKTHQFSEVDMEQYLTPLIDQIVNSYASPRSIRTVVEAKGVALDLARATPAGLIVNELVTNSLKHGFPKEATASRANEDPCTIGIRMTKEDGSYVLNVYDNGMGMPAGFDPLTAKSLGLKLVNFLARHQMRAKIEVRSSATGTEFVFRFKE